MKRKHIFTLGAVASIVACSENAGHAVTGPVDQPPPLPTPSLTTIAGRIIVTGTGGDQLVELQNETGTVYRLVGSQASVLASVDGGDVVARGTFDANPGFVVEDFQVTGMRGRPALDGVLEQTAAGFALRLRDGTLRVIPGLADCEDHVGARLWVTGYDGPEAEFGRIGAS